jgi:hypothetical protein
MKTTASFQDLGRQIERVVQEHIVASRLAAAAALERAFATTGAPARAPHSARSELTARRRAPTEMAAVGERLYQEVCAKPGETMAVLASDLGASPRELNRPMAHLRQAGRIRSVGQRHLTRYFPLVSKATQST